MPHAFLAVAVLLATALSPPNERTVITHYQDGSIVILTQWRDCSTSVRYVRSRIDAEEPQWRREMLEKGHFAAVNWAMRRIPEMGSLSCRVEIPNPTNKQNRNPRISYDDDMRIIPNTSTPGARK